MQLVCELEEFFLVRLNIEALNCDLEAEAQAARISFDYDLATAVEDDHRIKMEMSFSLTAPPEEESLTCPYAIDAAIVGFFKFPQDLEDQQIAYLCRVNTMTMLYGILRGQVATVTGSFPHGKFTLPAVMMQDVVNKIEQRKQSVDKEESQ